MKVYCDNTLPVINPLRKSSRGSRSTIGAYKSDRKSSAIGVRNSVSIAASNALFSAEDEPGSETLFELPTDNNETSTKARDCTFILDPRTQLKVRWDVCIGLLIVYSVTLTPYHIGFVVSLTAWQNYLNYIVDSVFAIDIVLNFFTGYYDGELYICKLRKIQWRYLRSWFLIDAISVYPFDLFAVYAPGGTTSSFTSLKLLRTARLSRLLKMMRLLRLRRAFRSTQHESMNVYVLQTVKSLIVIVFIIHLIACAWYMFHTWDPTSHSWVSNVDAKMMEYPYLMSFYWVAGTMMSVGYGDIVGITDAERIFAIFVMLLGSVCVGLIIANIQMLTENYNPRGIKMKEKLMETKEFLIKKNVPRNLRQRVLSQFEYHWNRRSAYNENKVLEAFPKHMRYELLLASVKPFVRLFPVFGSTSVDFFVAVIPNLKPNVSSTGQFLVEAECVWEDVYFILTGSLEVLKNNIAVSSIGGGDICAIECLVTEKKRYSHSYRTSMKCEVFALSTVVLMKSIKQCSIANTYFKEMGQNAFTRYEGDASHRDPRNSVSRRSLKMYRNLGLDLQNHLLQNAQKITEVKKGMRYEDGMQLHWSVIRPNYKFRIFWDIIMGFIVLLIAISIPVRIAFDMENTTFFAIDRVSDCFFLLDIVLNFFTSYIDDAGLEIVDAREIRLHYLRSSFVLDVVSTIPLDWIVEISTTKGNFLSLKLIRAVKFVKLIRLVRILKLFKLKSLVHSDIGINTEFVQLLKLAIPVLATAHYVGCFWYYLSAHQGADKTVWFTNTYFQNPNSLSSKYVASLYWAITTMATVGYGDIYAVTPSERSYATFVMIGGAIIFAYVIGTVIEIVSHSKTLMNSEHAHVQKMMSYVKERGGSKELLRAYQTHLNFVSDEKTFYNQQNLFESLTCALRSELILFINTNVVSRIRFFDKKPKWFLAILLPKLIPQYFAPGDVLIRIHSGVQGMYFILSGVAVARSPSGEKKSVSLGNASIDTSMRRRTISQTAGNVNNFLDPSIVATMCDGECFAYKEALMGGTAEYNVVCLKPMGTYLLPCAFLNQLAVDFPSVLDEMKPFFVNSITKQQAIAQRTQDLSIVGMDVAQRQTYLSSNIPHGQHNRREESTATAFDEKMTPEAKSPGAGDRSVATGHGKENLCQATLSISESIETLTLPTSDEVQKLVDSTMASTRSPR
uniref:Potassium/sodium hyperpolarizationactivated cyclic nucleotidegated channel putative n=1 Tax=Albugo laibachii Nc14 TaxID=890382 RepID=F0W479_9STRA|nr:potassium/sodium hyperpolarizationactivated cyclic nucleotidegated channel putative [Albugo laibachii Nc14]CCA26917.1 potassium/sodium hyperpolarizationactivated cyclic nucleotidegated channel putative [Albugo laibachii Nc14]|eukprot:CCA26917.1 potassium/sodium hyperpolarizationactivated cyclic nucleotidegated channel putative [Albugo laibachii Nc14]